MKQGIHPNYVDCTITWPCGHGRKTYPTKPCVPEDGCSKCHPCCAGEVRLWDTDGRVERFNKRFGRK